MTIDDVGNIGEAWELDESFFTHKDFGCNHWKPEEEK
jgi:hypothetical protein